MNTNRLWGSLALCTALLLRAPAGAATPVFLIDSAAGDPAAIFRVDTSNGHLTPVGALPAALGVAAALAAASDNLLYVGTDAADLIEVTVSPFSFVNLGSIGSSLVGMTYWHGQLYAIDEITDQLSRIQVAPLVQTVIGKVRIGSVAGPVLDVDGADLAVDVSGTGYLWTNAAQGLFTLDLATAVATPLGAGALGTRSGLAWDFQGDRLLASSGPLDALLTLDPTSGATLGALSFCVEGSCPTAFDHRFGDLASPPCIDADGDGFSPEGGGCGPVDCDDGDAAVHPGAAEQCNGADDDCNGTADDEPTASASCANACTTSAQCVSGACVTTPLPCDDGNACTSDSCDAGLGCQHADQPDGLSCSDGNVCTGEETCLGGVCTNASDLDCNDGNACTVDSCAAPNGCRNAPIPGCCTTDADCTDVSACTIHERCAAGSCVSDALPCDDGNLCTNDSCNPASGCVNLAVVNGTVCADANVCNGVETCQLGICSGGSAADCNDHNACTADSCDAGLGCTHSVLPGCCTTAPQCADGNLCNGVETCDGLTHQCEAGGSLACTPGSHRPSRTCAAEWFIDNPHNPRGVLSRYQDCQQGDASCDHDAAPGTCTFNVAVCLRVPDPRLQPPCTLADISRYSLYRPSVLRDPASAGALLAALDTLPGAMASAAHGGRDVDFTPPLDAVRCAPPTALVVPVGKAMSLRGRAITATGVKDEDVTIRLRCVGP